MHYINANHVQCNQGNLDLVQRSIQSMKGFCWSCQAAEHTHPHAAWSYWRNVCWCRPTCQSERWQTPPWSLSGPAAALCPERTYHSASSLWPLQALRFVFMTCEHSCGLATKAGVTQIWPRIYSTWLFSWPGVPLSPAAAMYVLPIVLIFSTPLNFGLDSSCLVREAQKETECYEGTVPFYSFLNS